MEALGLGFEDVGAPVLGGGAPKESGGGLLALRLKGVVEVH